MKQPESAVLKQNDNGTASFSAVPYIWEVIKIRKINRGDVYMAEIENAKGSEQSGIRPAVIIQNNIGNKFSTTTIVAFVTSKRKKNMPTHVKIRCNRLPKKSTVMLEQIRTISVNRLKNYVGTLSFHDMKRVDRALKISLGFTKAKG